MSINKIFIYNNNNRRYRRKGRQLNVGQDAVFELEADNRPLCSELDSMKINVNALEQYGRRNSLRFNNFMVITSQKEEDMIHGPVRFINNNLMPSGEKINDRDGERCHLFGRKVRDNLNKLIINIFTLI